jgi:hypothetical protein
VDIQSRNDIIEATRAAFGGAHEALKSGHGFRIRRDGQGLCTMYWGKNLSRHVLELAINPEFAPGPLLGWVEREILEKRCQGAPHWNGRPKGERPWPTRGFISVPDAKEFLAVYQEIVSGERDVETLYPRSGRPTSRRMIRTRPVPARDDDDPAEALLARFRQKTARMPETTVAHRLARQRIGQRLLRRALITLCGGRCAVTGLSTVRLLRASHIKPWSKSSDSERLNPANALLLAPNLDAAFDAGFITFENDGRMRVSPVLSADDQARLGQSEGVLSVVPSLPQQQFLAWHRERQFKVR